PPVPGATSPSSAPARGASSRSRIGRARDSWSIASSPPCPPRSATLLATRWTQVGAMSTTEAVSSATRGGRAASSPPGGALTSTRDGTWTRRRSCLVMCRTLTRSWATSDNDGADSSRRRSSSVNLPIGLTLRRIVAVPLLIVFLISSSRVHAVIAAAIFTLAAITDWADGMLARRRNQVTTLGALLDPIADKLLVAAALVSLLAIDKIDAWIVVVIVGRELAVTGLRAVAASVGVIVPASRLAKWKTVSQYIAITMLIVEKGFDPPGFRVAATASLWAALGLTIISAVDYFYRFFSA